ncbi:MAG: ribosome-associated translation inhibitor RaiA [Chloroflexi bacterium]|nr:ribosome-associated translation inhibitor RaiA [Chloroflexota bacterium]
MNLEIIGRNIEITDTLEEYVQKKLGKLERYLPDITDVRVELSEENTRDAAMRQVVQVTTKVKRGKILRGEERSADMFSAIDSVLDKMYQQIARYKGKRLARWRRGATTAEDELMLPIEDLEEEEPGKIVRIKRFAMAPMTELEAIEQMELLGHTFFVFFNPDQGDRGGVQIVYRRRNGDYGWIIPELV